VLASGGGGARGVLEAAPQGDHVETVKLRIQNLEKRVQEQDKAKADAGAPPAPVPNPRTDARPYRNARASGSR